MLDRWITDASDDEVLQFIDDCCPTEPDGSELKIEFINIDETISLLTFVAHGLQQQKIEFIRKVQWDHSSEALTHAQTFKLLLKLQADLLSILNAHGGLSERFIAQLPRYPGNVR